MWEGGTHLAAFITHGGDKLPVKEFTGLTHHTDWIPTLVRLPARGKTQSVPCCLCRLLSKASCVCPFPQVAAGNGTLTDTVKPAMDGINMWPAFMDPSSVSGPRDSVILNVDVTNNVRVCVMSASGFDMFLSHPYSTLQPTESPAHPPLLLRAMSAPTLTAGQATPASSSRTRRLATTSWSTASQAFQTAGAGPQTAQRLNASA
jgi:hypothetical protein